MSNLERALEFAKQGLYVFPVNHTTENEKIPYTRHGLLDGTTDEETIRDWWTDYPNAKIGVWAGESGLNILDVDVKDGKDGFDSLAFYDIPDTYFYETGTGGYHYWYAAPEGVTLAPAVRYLKMEGVDRRAGLSYVMVPDGVDAPTRDEFSPAPDWLNAPSRTMDLSEYDGTVQDWYKILEPGEPNALVRKAMSEIPQDPSHQDMVRATAHAVRLGAEGNSGVPELLAALEDAWLNRPAENHTTPEAVWPEKFAEAVAGGVRKFGDKIDLLKKMGEFKPEILPADAPRALYIGLDPSSKAEWFRALEALVSAGADEGLTLRVMWGSPRTKTLSRDWGVEFVNKQVQEMVSNAPPVVHVDEPEEEPTQIAPISGNRVVNRSGLKLLTEPERAAVAKQYTFPKMFIDVARQDGFVNEKMLTASAWNVLSMALGFHGFVPESSSFRMPLNLWFVTLAPSGTGKSSAQNFEDKVLDLLFREDCEEQPYRVGDRVSPQGLHMALLNRNRRATYMSSDESAGFFRSLTSLQYMAQMPQDLSQYYDGEVPPSNKISTAEMKGKSGETSFNMHLRSTPDKFIESVTRDQFTSGFMARTNWVIENKKEFVPDQLEISEFRGFKEGVDAEPGAIMELVVFLKTMQLVYPSTLPIYTSDEALARQTRALNDMRNHIEGHDEQDILEPTVRRIGYQSIRKVSALNALFRGSKEVELSDVLVAIDAAQVWFDNLFYIASRVQSEYERQAQDIENFIRDQKGQVATRAQILRKFKGTIKRDSKEIDSKLTFLVESKRIVQESNKGGGVRYRANA